MQCYLFLNSIKWSKPSMFLFCLGDIFKSTNKQKTPISLKFLSQNILCSRFERNPSIRLFRQNLRHRIQAALVQPPAGANCEPDDDELLSTMTIGKEKEPHSGSSLACESATTALPTEEHENSLTPESDTDEENDAGLGSSLPSLQSCSVR